MVKLYSASPEPEAVVASSEPAEAAAVVPAGAVVGAAVVDVEEFPQAVSTRERQVPGQ